MFVTMRPPRFDVIWHLTRNSFCSAPAKAVESLQCCGVWGPGDGMFWSHPKVLHSSLAFGQGASKHMRTAYVARNTDSVCMRLCATGQSRKDRLRT